MIHRHPVQAELADGLNILELGCGWGSLSLWMAAAYPNSRIVLVGHHLSVDAGTRKNLVMPALVTTYAFWGFVVPVFLGAAAGTGALYGMLVLME